MGKKAKVIIGLLLVAVMLLTPIALADEYAYSRVVFTVPVVLSFQITVPGPFLNSSTPTHPGNNTPDIWFNGTTPDDKWIVPCMGPTGGDCQVAFTDPILKFTNTGSIPFNISIRFNKTVDSTVMVYANFSYPDGEHGPDGGCTGSSLGDNETVITEPTVFNFTKALCVNNETDVWFWANFTGATGTKYNTLNYTSFI